MDSIRRFPVLILALMLFLCGRVLYAQEVTATASLATPEIAMGQLGELTIEVRGANSATPPDRITVPGLVIQQVGVSTRIEMNNARVTSSVVYTYHIAAEKEGTFEIPGLRFTAGGKTVTTKPLTLRVVGRVQSPMSQRRLPRARPQPTQPPVANSNARTAFAEWVFPKTTAYVGEAIPVELRLYVASQIRWNLQQYPPLAGDGFTLQKFSSRPKQDQVVRDGQTYDVVIFKTAFTAVKAGKLVLEPTEIHPIMFLPRRGPRSGLPRALADLFDDPFFNNAFLEPQQVTVKTEPVEIEVKPLPVQGRPESFTGAVGRFTLETSAQPLKVTAGDPITLTARISGIGSFERMEQPVLEDAAGWKSYPPSVKFNADDEVGITGTKVFDFAVIPGSAGGEKRKLPVVEFSYFDPHAEKYVTLKSDPIEVTVEPSAAGAAPSAPAATPAVATTPAPSATPEPEAGKVEDIHYIRLDRGKPGSFEPAWKSVLFWAVQGVALLAVAAWGISRWMQARPGPSEQVLLKREKDAARRALSTTAAKPFYDAAARFLQAETALKRGMPLSSLESIGLREALSCQLDEETAAGVREIFSRHDEYRYSGGVQTAEQLHADQIARVRRILEQFEKSHA